MHFLREFRDKHGLTQAALAEHLGVTPLTIIRWERAAGAKTRMLELALRGLTLDLDAQMLKNGPATRAGTLAERQRWHARGELRGFFKLEDGSWSDWPTVKAMPEGATWWWTGESSEGRWTQRRNSRPGMSHMPTGQTDRWPPYAWWEE
jgi:transcriptional regulator with XRE-family HTH domain